MKASFFSDRIHFVYIYFMRFKAIFSEHKHRKTAFFSLIILGIFVLFSTASASNLKGYFRYDVTAHGSHLKFTGDSPSEQFGGATASGDFNGDSFRDLAVSSPTFSSNGKNFRGKVTIFLGGPTFFSTVSSLTFLGSSENQQLGASVQFGDFNGDKLDDLVMGTTGSGKVVFAWGRRNLPFEKIVDFSTKPPDFVIQSIFEHEKFGFSLDVADLNRDSRMDLIVGAPDGVHEKKKRAGRAYIFYGSDTFAQDFIRHLYYRPANLILGGTRPGDQFGSAFAHGDFNADGLPDLAAGSYLDGHSGQEQRGTVSVFYGLPDGTISKTSEDFLEGEEAFSWFSYSLAAGDINHDSVDDLAVSSFPFSKPEVASRIDIFWGGIKGDMDLRRMTISHPDPNYALGSSVVLGDINRDGMQDIFIGAIGLRASEEMPPGRVFLLSNFSRTTGRTTLAKLADDLRISGNTFYDWFGANMLFDDFNGDFAPDLIISAPSDEIAEKGRVGSIYVFPGPLLPRGDLYYQVPSEEETVSRASVVDQIVQAFDLKNREKDFLDQCFSMKEFCFLNFTGQSRFEGLQLEPKFLLYPDVLPSDPYYESLNITTALGLVRGYIREKNSPFHPDEPILRIHALKILLQTVSALQWKERAELIKDYGGLRGLRMQKTPFLDVSAKIPHMWWYPRYVNYAHLTKIITDQNYFAPDEPLTQKVLNEWISATKLLFPSP